LTIRRRLTGIAIVLAFAAGALAVVADHGAAAGSRNLACSTCPRPIEQPR
jgi:hypothetical protein